MADRAIVQGDKNSLDGGVAVAMGTGSGGFIKSVTRISERITDIRLYNRSNKRDIAIMMGKLHMRRTNTNEAVSRNGLMAKYIRTCNGGDYIETCVTGNLICGNSKFIRGKKR